MNLHRKFVHGNIYLEKQARNYLKVNKSEILLSTANRFYDEVEVESNTDWIIV